jgi:glycine hydroxymethyltransferase
METVVALIDKVLMNLDDNSVVESVKADVKALMAGFPLYPEMG